MFIGVVGEGAGELETVGGAAATLTGNLLKAPRRIALFGEIQDNAPRPDIPTKAAIPRGVLGEVKRTAKPLFSNRVWWIGSGIDCPEAEERRGIG